MSNKLKYVARQVHTLIILLLGMSESKNFPIKSLHAAKYYDVLMVITAHYSELRTPNCTKEFRRVSTTLRYPRCWVVTTFGIAGLQRNSIKYYTLDKEGTQSVSRLLQFAP